MPSNVPSKIDLKVVLLGRWYCGKTSLVERFIYNRFEDKYQNTIGAAFSAKTLKIKNEELVVSVWDTVGDERYESISKMYYRNARAAVVCYDLTDPESWKRAKFWVEEVRSHEETCKIYLCGTKLDLLKNTDRATDFRDVTKYTKEFDAKEFETSSKTGENIDQLFEEVAKDYLAFRMTLDPEVSHHRKSDNIRLTSERKENFFARLGTECCSS